MDFIKHQITINGLKITYHTAGSGAPLLFLHGMSARGLTYKNALTLLAQKYSVIALDLPGFGDSEMFHKVSDFDDYASFVHSFIQELQLHTITVVGHSFGGGVGIRLASLSDEVSRLVAIDSDGLYETVSPKLLHNLLIKKTIYDLTQYKNSLYFFVIAKDALNTIFKKLKSVHILFQSLMKCARQDLSHTKISVPVLLLWGKDDEVFSHGYAEKLHANLKNSELKYVEGNHDWILFKPEQLTAYL